MRVAIVGAFLANILVLVLVARAVPFSAATGLFLAYFLGAVVLLILTHRSERAALLSWYMIPLLALGEPYAATRLYRYVGRAPGRSLQGPTPVTG
jgi:hypothetical protein